MKTKPYSVRLDPNEIEPLLEGKTVTEFVKDLIENRKKVITILKRYKQLEDENERLRGLAGGNSSVSRGG